MRAVIQRVTLASVSIDGVVRGQIGHGFVVLFAAGAEDTADLIEPFWAKMERLRIFADQEGKTNLSLSQVEGEILLIPQFTLYANARRGNRPSFTEAARPEEGEALFEAIKEIAHATFPGKVQWGVFGADMQVELVNDGPFTVILDSKTLFKS